MPASFPMVGLAVGWANSMLSPTELLFLYAQWRTVLPQGPLILKSTSGCWSRSWTIELWLRCIAIIRPVRPTESCEFTFTPACKASLTPFSSPFKQSLTNLSGLFPILFSSVLIWGKCCEIRHCGDTEVCLLSSFCTTIPPLLTVHVQQMLNSCRPK